MVPPCKITTHTKPHTHTMGFDASGKVDTMECQRLCVIAFPTDAKAQWTCANRVCSLLPGQQKQ